MSKKISRREFNALASKAAMGLPVMASLYNTAGAQTTLAPKRLIMLRSKNGILHANWAMNGGQPWDRSKVKQNDPMFATNLATQHAQDVNYLKLTDVAYTNYIIENTTLKNYKSKINLISGLDMMTRHSHNCFNFLCGSTVDNVNANEYYGPAFTYSIDWVLEKKFINKVKFPVPVLRVVPFANQNNVVADYGLLSSLSYHPDEGSFYGDYKRTPYLTTLKGTFQKLFGNATAPTNTLSLNEKIRTQILARGQMMAQKRSLSSTDKSRIQNFMDHLTGIPLGSSGGGSGGGSCNNGADIAVSGDYGISGNYEKTMDLVVQALACQTSQVAVISIGDHESQAIDGGWHTITHESHFSSSIFYKYEGFVGNQVAYLINKLATTLDADGSSLLDNTLVVWGAEHSTGYHHESIDVPIMTIGGGNMNIQQGYYIDYRKRNPTNTASSGPLFYVPLDNNDTDTDRHPLGRPYNDFLVTLMQIMGVSPATYHASNLDGKYGSVGTFGSTSVGFGEYSHPVTGSWNMANNTKGANDLFKQVYRSVLPSDSPLPFFYKGA